MSPTIMRELLAIRRTLTTHVVEQWGGTRVSLADEQVAYYRGALGITGVLSPVKCMTAELPYRRYHEEMEREEEAYIAAGYRHICPECGVRAAKDGTACTYGYPGHPGADYTAYLNCEACGKFSM